MEFENITEDAPLISTYSVHPVSSSTITHRIRLFGGMIWKSGTVRDMIKAMVAFSLTMFLTFNDYFNEKIGFFSHMAAVSILFFHPCKSVGGMFEAVVLGLLGVLGSASIGLIVAFSTVQMGNHSIIRTLFIISFIFFSTFVLAYLRARSSRPPIYTGTIISHMMIFTILTSNIDDTISGDLIGKIKSLSVAFLSGIAVGLFSNLVLWPTSASFVLKRDTGATMHSLEHLLSLIVSSFLLENNDEHLSVDKNSLQLIEESMEMHQTQFIHLTRSHAEAKMEFIRPYRSTSSWNTLIASLNRLSRHLGGLKSSVVKLSKLDVGGYTPLHRPVDLVHAKKCDIDLLHDLLLNFGPAIKDLSGECSSILIDLENVLSTATGWWNVNYSSSLSVKQRIFMAQTRIDHALSKFETEQKLQMFELYESKKYDGRPADEVFLVYHFIFCLIEFAKEIKYGLGPKLAIACGISLDDQRGPNRRKRGTWLTSWFSATTSVYENDPDETASESYFDIEEELSPLDEMPKISRFLHPKEDSSTSKLRKIQEKTRYFEYLQSQTNDAYHHYLKSPSTALLPVYSPVQARSRSQRVQSRSPSPPVKISFFLRHRLRLWHFLSQLRNSFNVKFALKTALLVTSIASLAFITATKDVFQMFRMHWSMISVVVVMSPTVGGTNVAGLYRILGTCLGSLYSYGMSYLVYEYIGCDRETIGKWIIFAGLFIFAIPCFYIFLFSKYPRVGQVTLVTVLSISLAQEANYRNPNWNISISELALKRGLMVSFGILLGLIVNWYVWPFEARVELRKGLSDLLLNMGILYSRLVEVFNSSAAKQALEPGSLDLQKKRKITVSTLHNYYYTQFSSLTPEDTYSYFLAFELKLHMALLRLDQLIPLTWLEPRLKGPFPVEIYKKIVKKCMLILDKFASMRIALGNHLHLTPDDNDETEMPPMHGFRRERSKTCPDLNINPDLILGPVHSEVNILEPSGKESTSDDNQQYFNHEHIPSRLLPYRKELVGAVLQCFYIYSGSLILKQPLPTYLPPMNEARRRLMNQLKVHMRKDAEKSMKTQDGTSVPLTIAIPEQFINYYAYSLAMEDVISELEELGQLLKSLFGEMFADVVQIHMEEADAGEVLTEMNNGSNSVNTHASKTARNTMEIMEDDEEEAVRWWRSSGHWML